MLCCPFWQTLHKHSADLARKLSANLPSIAVAFVLLAALVIRIGFLGLVVFGVFLRILAAILPNMRLRGARKLGGLRGRSLAHPRKIK